MLIVSFDNYAFIYHTYLCKHHKSHFSSETKQHVFMNTSNSSTFHPIDYFLQEYFTLFYNITIPPQYKILMKDVIQTTYESKNVIKIPLVDISDKKLVPSRYESYRHER